MTTLNDSLTVCLPCFLPGTTRPERLAVVCLRLTCDSFPRGFRGRFRASLTVFASLRYDVPPHLDVCAGTVTSPNAPQPR
jgi:hypothetical protein